MLIKYQNWKFSFSGYIFKFNSKFTFINTIALKIPRLVFL